MKTKAAILYEVNKPLIIDEVEIPKLKKGQVLVKFTSSGICRGQLNEVVGWKGEDKYLPHLLGHEGAGKIMEVGGGVTKVVKGDFVVASWIKGKGLEGGNVKYKLGEKTINAGSIATFCEYGVISENRLVKTSPKIPPEVASLLGCAVPTGAGVVFNAIKPTKDSAIAVFGVGGVGSSAILASKVCNCRKIIAVDVNKKKLEFAKMLGATDTIESKGNNVVDLINKISPGGVSYAIEATGVKEVMEEAFESLNYSGSLVIAGNLRAGETININPYELIRGKKLLGTWGGETDPDRDIPRYEKLYLEGKLKLEKLIFRKFQLDEINEALALLKTNESLGRMVIEYETK